MDSLRWTSLLLVITAGCTSLLEAAQFSGQARILFAMGAMAASLVWFYGIGYGARIFAPLFRKSLAWRVLDILVGCTMWGIGVSLIWKRVFTG